MKKLLCMLLVAAMLVTALTFSVFAEEIIHAGTIVLDERLALGVVEGEYYSLTITEAFKYCFESSYSIKSIIIYLDGAEIFSGYDHFGDFYLEPGNYDVQITNLNDGNTLTVSKIPALESFDITEDTLYLSIHSPWIDYDFNLEPMSECVSEYKFVIADEAVIEPVEDYFIAKSVGETVLTFTAVDYYGNEFTDTVKVVVMPNIKWDLQETSVLAYPTTGCRTLEFTVPETGVYRIYSTDETYDPYAILYCNGEYVNDDDDTNADYNFEIIEELTAGETYELLVCFYDAPGKTVIKIEEYADPAAEVIPDTINLHVGDVYNMYAYGISSLNVVPASEGEEPAVEAVTVSDSKITAVTEGKSVVEYSKDEETYTITVNVTATPALEADKATIVDTDNFFTNKVYSFTAPEAGVYRFGTTGNTDTCGILYDSDRTNQLHFDDDDGSGANFYIPYELEADQTVYIEVYCYYSGENEFELFAAKEVDATGIKIVPDENYYFAFTDNVYYTLYGGTPDFDVQFLGSYGAKEESYDVEYTDDEDDPNLRTITVTTVTGLTDSATFKYVKFSMGDINLDGVFDDADYLYMKKCFDEKIDLPDAILILADFNFDMYTDETDLAAMLDLLGEQMGHSYELTQNGSIVDVTCSIGEIECPDHSGTVLSVTATGGEYNGEPFTAAVTNLIAEDMLDGSVSEIYYVGTGDTVYEATTQAPVEAGTYKAYVTVSDCEAYAEFEITESEPTVIGLRGDVNENGSIDARDYVTLKRAYFGTASLNETATLLADVNNNGGIDARDYVMLKRAYFKTYEIPEEIKYVY